MKTPSLLLLLATAAFACAAETPATPLAPLQPKACDCCKKTPVAAPKVTDACCRDEADATHFSKESIYQLDGRFTDDSGRPFSLRSLRGRPVVLDMFFASCGYACPLTVTDMLDLQQRLPARLRDQAVFVLVSFDVAHDTSAVLAKYREQRHLGGNWILLRGDEDNVRELAALLGVQYRETANGMFSHSNQITILNRAGEIVHERRGLKGGLGETVAALAQDNR
jgi:protein SCO1/2